VSKLTGAIGPATMSVADAAELLSIGLRSAYRACHSGVIPSMRINGRIVVKRIPLMQMLESSGFADEQ
jgi:excisionase family DNA binding protein